MKLYFNCKIRLCLLFVVFVLSQNLSGQYYCGVSYEEKIETIVQAIPVCYANKIGITEASLANIISPVIDMIIDEEAPFPIPTVASTTDIHHFNWAPIPQANFYRVRYINLVTGELNHVLTEEESFSLARDRDALYLFLFSAMYNEEGMNYRSVDYVIIDEKPILEPEPSTLFKRPIQCLCEVNHDVSFGKKTAEKGKTNLDLTIYPNPSDAVFFIEYYLQEKGTVNLWLNDVTGKLVRQIQSRQTQESGIYQLEISIDDLPSGLYHCVLQTKNGLAHSQILIK